ncbi:hypothetical protein [Actinoplanes regularis]|uniref:hypothetical protein n=1 Tax=Actinoplanes regularis TaxID=52697 RepID=UPI001177BCF1|nr:hypothetical protein [Actinoplanes regularis]
MAERLGQVIAEARSPDGGLWASFRGSDDLQAGFAPGAYRRYSPADLERRLGALAAVLWARYRREYLEVVAAWADSDADPEQNAEDRRFQQALEQLDVAGTSPARWVRVTSRALASWDFRLRPETLRVLPEHEFLAETTGAVTALLADHRAKTILLTDEVYDIGLPRSMREAGAQHP